ncbi:hypothetical protein [Sinomonas terrae]|uniref:Uncharacterized protein n=1 Tax=Sinomonas terrae TaxID=2908838 RepID=A0ABS9U3U3_9MICC|nr:hypothetical protein [Sinomonas terrae]MCH6471338.1 hypothetical protein [Sinomonas terrae]
MLAQAEARKRQLVPGWNTPNGWAAENMANAGGTIWTREVASTAVVLTVRDDEPRAVLEYVVQRFNAEVHSLNATDAVGFDPATRGRGALANLASGTAVNILPGFYPRGGGDEMYDHEVRTVQDILRGCAGLVGWGGEARPRSQGFFYLQVPPGSRLLKDWVAKRREDREHLGIPAVGRPLGV